MPPKIVVFVVTLDSAGQRSRDQCTRDSMAGRQFYSAAPVDVGVAGKLKKKLSCEAGRDSASGPAVIGGC